MDKTVNIFLVTDRQNLGNLKVTLLMLLAHANGDSIYHIFILFNEMTDSDKGEILAILGKNNRCKASFYPISEKDFVTALPSDTPHTSKVGRFKYLIGNFDIEKALYIDTDILLRVDLADLFQADLEEHIVGAIPDVNNRLFNKDLKLPSDFNYFNSGVLLINCKKWKENNISELLLETSIKREKDIIYVDQDTFNIIFAELGYKKLGLEWNFPSAIQYFNYNLLNYIKKYWSAYSVSEIIKAFKKPYLVHFIGKPKPNEGNEKTPYAAEYLKYCSLNS